MKTEPAPASTRGGVAPPGATPSFREWWLVLGLVGLVLVAYAPALQGDFIWNDLDYVTRPELRSLHGLWRIWFEVGATEQYYPLLHSAFWMEYRLWGASPLGYHLANVAQHATAACLLAAVLRRLAIPGAWLAAAIFALHPVCVESVAWISEQKNTLSTVFYLLAALVYLRFDAGRIQANEVGARRSAAAYFLATTLFVLALLSKSVTATLPAALLVVFWWRRGSLGWRRDFRPLLPWFALGAAVGLFTGWVERTYIGADGAGFALTFVQRCLIAGRIIWFYLGKLFWPADLIFIYPRWMPNATAVGGYLFPLGVLALAFAFWLMRRRTRGPLAGLLFFAGTLFPTLGFFNVYAFIFSYVADHWQYLASLGVIVPVAAGWGRIRWGPPLSRGAGIWRTGAQFAAVAAIGMLGALTWRQSRMYADIETFYRTTLAKNPACWMAQNNLGVLLVTTGRLAEAIPHYQEALRLKPDFAQAHLNLGVAQFETGRREDAQVQYREALRLNPSLAEADFNLGIDEAALGRATEAMADYRAALRLKPDFAGAEDRLGDALVAAGRAAEAISHLETAVRLRPDLVEARDNLGNALRLAGKREDAIQCHREALRLSPDDPVSHFDLGIDLADSGRLPEAIDHYERALLLRPAFPEAQENLGVALARAGRMAEAIPHFEEALRLKPDYAKARHDLNLALRMTRQNKEERAPVPAP